jgi:hypothetical protein
MQPRPRRGGWWVSICLHDACGREKVSISTGQTMADLQGIVRLPINAFWSDTRQWKSILHQNLRRNRGLSVLSADGSARKKSMRCNCVDCCMQACQNLLTRCADIKRVRWSRCARIISSSSDTANAVCVAEGFGEMEAMSSCNGESKVPAL